ncbi:hypothetical protein IAT38_005072 [Cryptococcus sp. DSM 104549]
MAANDPGARLDMQMAMMEPADTQQRPEEKQNKTKMARFVSYIWDPDYYDKSPQERRLVAKLDLTLLLCLTGGWFMKYTDQSNLAQAYVSGMKEDLGMLANQYTYLFTVYNAVICVLEVPCNLIILKFPPSYFLAACEIGWTIFTFAQAGAQNVASMYAFRFFVAFFEAAFQPASFLILGSWYTPTELGKRLAIWGIAAPAGQAFAGFAQAAIHKGLNGVGGLAGWRWLYIICGIMSVPFAAACFFLIPDMPYKAKPTWYLTQEDIDLANERCNKAGIKPAKGAINLKTFTEVLRHWRFWLWVPCYLVYAWGVQDYNYYTIWLKAENYSVTLRNILPAIAYLMEIPIWFAQGYISDRVGSRFWVIIAFLVWGAVPTGILAVWPESKTLKLFAFQCTNTYLITQLYFTWLNEVCKDSAEERAIIIGSAITLFYCFNAWLPTLIFLQTDGPSFRKGFPSVFACEVGCIGFFVAIYLMHNRQKRREAAQPQVEEGPVENYDEKESEANNTVVPVISR